MSFFELIQVYLKEKLTCSDDERVDLSDLLSKSPKTPPLNDEQTTVKMGQFDRGSLIENIIYNTYRQNVKLRLSTWRAMVTFFGGAFTDITSRIYLQILLHASKSNLTKVNESDREKIYDEDLASFLNRTAWTGTPEDTKVSYEVSHAASALVKKIKNFLTTPVILSAFEKCFNEIIRTTEEKIDFAWLRRNIGELQIYTVMQFRPMQSLRGATLVDGFLICLNKLPLSGDVFYDADLFTLSMHECAHFLNRLLVNAFNMSTPFKNVSSGGTRYDFTDKRTPPENFLEAGGAVECIVFDGVQPSWATSHIEAAEFFLNGLETNTGLPLFPAAEHKKLGLRSRTAPSPTFGIDLEDDTCIVELP